ncbi:MAG TPA: GNAT family N-acetyltransferase [Alphaproteobacteria bacterium]|nr:GNAT family N-acetyltransferase [Alphaproteobacteria bacterium]
MIEITAFRPRDRARWEILSRGYKTFYGTELPAADYEAAWQRLMAEDGIYGLAARLDGELVGIAHYFFHAHVWMADVCYLQDLFVDEAARGKGAARALIEAVARAAQECGAARFYWLTQEHNATARRLYDKVARFGGFIRYDYPLG